MESMQIIRGCKTELKNPKRWIEDISTTVCPLKVVTHESKEILRAYSNLQKGFLPNSGGWLDQPIKFHEAMEFVDVWVNKLRQQEEDNKNGG